MEVEIISEEWIKPSSSTPLHLKNYKLSFLDIRFGSAYIPLVLYYPFNQNTNLFPSDIDHMVSEKLQRLKKSLSETLSRFYPFAGKIKDPYFIDCNDEGVYFVQAKVRTPLNEFLKHPNMSLINKFLPNDGKWKHVPGDCPAAVQVTTFSCGGIGVGLVVSHMIADGTSFDSFLQSWAAVAHNKTEKAICPKFEASSFFPYNDEYPIEKCSIPLATLQLKPGRFITRRYGFDASAIANLKAKARSSSVPNPTRVDVVTALFSKCIMAPFRARSGSNKSILLNQAVNLRRRARPQLSDYQMGNLVWTASWLCEDHKKLELDGLVCQMKEAIAKLNGDFVNSLQGNGGWINYLQAVQSEREIYSDARDVVFFTSWRTFGFYDVNFGWGNPAWISIVNLAEFDIPMSSVILTDTKQKDGIEAWASLREEDVAMLERDIEFLALATVDPSPLK